MRFYSILYPSPAQETRAGHCPWLFFRPQRGGTENRTITRGNKTFAAKDNLTQGRQSPAFFADTGLDGILDLILPGRDGDALRCVYYELSVDRETVRYRQEIMRALEIPDIVAIFQTFCRAVEGAVHTMADGRKVRAPAQRDKYTVDGAAAYCDAVRELLEAASQRKISSDGLRSFVDAVRTYASGPRFGQMEALLRRAKDGVEAISFSLKIRNGRVLIGPAIPNGNFILETREDFACTAENAQEGKPHEIRLFGELELGPLGILIADALQGRHPGAFALLHRAAEGAEQLPEPFILAFTREFRFYTSFLETVQSLRAKGLSFAYPSISGGGVRIDGAYDMDLALKQDAVVPNDFHLTGDERGIVVTGANHSGKTTYIRAIGQIAVLAALGLPAPCGYAEMPLFAGFFSHFSDAEEGAAGKGRLKEELLKLRPILTAAGKGSLVLLNEMFSSTTAQDAQAMAVRIINTLTDSGVCVLCVTHTLGDMPKRMVSMAAQVAPDSHERLYKIVRAPVETHAHVDALLEAYRLSYRDIKERIGHGV
jgi:DNA mismatch repair protein MutS